MRVSPGQTRAKNVATSLLTHPLMSTIDGRICLLAFVITWMLSAEDWTSNPRYGSCTVMFVQIGPPLGPHTRDAAPTEASRQSWISPVWATAPFAPPLSNFHQIFASSSTDPNAAVTAARLSTKANLLFMSFSSFKILPS